MPNTKTKKFDFQIFLAVSMILLVICCAVFCSVFADTEKGVANAVAPSITVSSNQHFYIKQFTSWSELEALVKYYFYNVPDLFDSSVTTGSSIFVGSLSITYNTNSENNLTKKIPLKITYSQLSSDDMVQFAFSTIDSLGNDVIFFVSLGILSTKTFYISMPFAEPTDISNGQYYYNFNTPMSSNTWTQSFANYIFGSNNNVTAFTDFSFNYYEDYNLGCMLQITGGNFSDIPVRVDNSSQITELQNQITELQEDITRLNGIIESKDNTIDYYKSLLPAVSQVPIFDISKCTPSTFIYNGYTYSSDTIEATDSGWNIYDSRYNNKEIPSNYGVGFSFFLPDTYSNTQYQVSPFIECYLDYPTQVAKLLGFSIGYRNQNGEIIKIGDYSNSPGFGVAEFIINSPTRELVFFEEDCNRMEMSKNMSIATYVVYTQVLYDEAYAEGYKTGYGYGKYIGKNEGIEEANDYSFFSLFSAVFDAPITAIVGRWGDSDGDGVYEREGGMLNFYIPGLDINFAPFLLSIFTLAIIVMIIRFILARKS